MTTNREDKRLLVKLPSKDKKKIMKTNHQDTQNLLLILTGRGLKYLLLTLAGFAIAFVVFQVFGAFSVANILLSPPVWILFARVAISLFCLFAIAMILESWR